MRVSRDPSLERAKAAAYIMCYLLIEAGYFIGLDKSQLVPSTWVRFLGFVCDSVRQASLVPEDKKVKFAALRKDILSSPYVGLKTLQRFSGKVISFSLAIPGCKLYVRDVFRAISRISGSTRPSVKLEAALRTEIEYWRFLDSWKDCLPWRTERHAVVTLYCDASKRAWGGSLLKDGRSLESRDYWIDNSQDINVLESRALLHSLLSFRHHISSHRVDVHTDSLVLKSALENDGCKNADINNVLKDIFDCCREFNFSLDVHYVPSSENPAYYPSRKVSDIDCMLSVRAWEPVERLFGPHTFDLMSLDSNCQRDGKGRCLPHFTPCATPGSSGINVFAQSLPSDHNLYVFPPFVLIAPLLKCMFEQGFHGAFTIVIPDLKPRRFWWALLQSLAVDRVLLGYASMEVSPTLFGCLYPNDSDANYCQACGTSTGLHLAATSTVRVDETAIKERFKEFQTVMRSNPYQRQKSALEQQLSQFLGALTPPKTVTSCTASDIVNFLIFKDRSGPYTSGGRVLNHAQVVLEKKGDQRR
ncbi:hypothetical protein ACROYT_G030099 [Oculina patagonica]